MAINNTRNQLSAYELRRLAEERLSGHPAEPNLPGSDEDNQKLIHELEVHQIELEMQNEELRQARDETEKALETYTELYDFAPVGYITIGRNSDIRAVNLTGAALLGIERSKLTDKRFEQFVTREYRQLFKGFLDKVFASQNKEACELALLSKGKNSLFVQIEAMATSSGQKCRIALIDITERKRLAIEIQQARQYAENIVETIRRPLLVLNSDLMVLSANQSFYRTFRTVPGATIGTIFHNLGNGQWKIPGLQERLRELLCHDTQFNIVEVEHVFPEIGHRIITLNARRIISENSVANNILLALEDITQRKELEAEIQDALEYAENIVETVREPLVVLDSDLKILTANQSFYEKFRVTPGETIGNFIYDLGNRQWNIPKLRILFEEILPRNTVINGYEVEHDFQEIGRKTILLNARQIFRKNIGSRIILLAMEDITERKKTEVILRHECTHDSLTGLYNRAFFDEELERLSQGRTFPLSIIMADINGLKKVNDTLGHKAGDQLIRLAARTIHGAFRAEEIVARIGGDEFVVILTETAANVAEEVVRRIKRSPEIIEGQVSIAFGVSTAESKEQITEAIKQSDERMYLDKTGQKELGKRSVQ